MCFEACFNISCHDIYSWDLWMPDETHANFKMRSRRFCISNVPMHSISDPLKNRRWNPGCMYTALRRWSRRIWEYVWQFVHSPALALRMWQKKEEGIGERSRERPSKKQKEKIEKDVAFSKGTYRGWYFILGLQAPPLPRHLPGLLSPVDAVLAASP